MNDLFEVRFETKMVVASSKLPKGLTEPANKIIESMLPVLQQAVKDFIEGRKETEGENK
jgi:hypothetical protein